MKVAIIGFGHMGQAFSKIVRSSIEIAKWDKNPTLVPNQQSLGVVVSGADLILMCVPTKCAREALIEIQPYLNKQAGIVSISKGMEAVSEKLAYEIIEEILPNQPYAILIGPMLANELGGLQGAAGVVASRYSETQELLEQALSTEHIILERLEDISGIATVGVLKNIYTVLLGISKGLGFGLNIHGYLLNRAILEMREIALELKLSPEIIFTSAGLGDFVATSMSDKSCNLTAGVKMAKGEPEIYSEGIYSLPSLLAKIKDVKSYPLLEVLKTLIVDKQNPSIEFAKFINSQS